ncbi:HSF-type DNA-binding-domain-containing protein [Hygrophoropsis aurantiaca]|uniref:HSF-type DNA-binding-domain-containing protein n=1 Tax=Hygrophoropsis aurantiaca TaxID=72124 RepID=A0ACB8A4T9_9AGAM|nr:HSF-type DNA-binding-domain-containing protein [Hygrophoropsis aurantiaca]
MKREQQQPPPPQPPPSQQKQEADDSMPATSDFVKKLYKMLEEQTFANVVSWGPHGDCFVVKDMNEFTKSILPRMFKHSNFASFVRQLNKYDFHKVKNTDDNQFGEHSWTFRHPDFHADRRDALENIKRKVPTQRKSLPSSSLRPTSGSPGPGDRSGGGPLSDLQSQVGTLQAQNEVLRGQVGALEGKYQDVLGEMVNFQRSMAQQDGVMQGMIQYFLGIEGGECGSQQQQQQQQQQLGDGQNLFLAAQEARQMMGDGAGRASLVQMSELSRRAEVTGGVAAAGGGFSKHEALARISEMHAQRMAASASSSGSSQSQPQSQSQQSQSQTQSQGGPGSEPFVIPQDMSSSSSWDSGAHTGLQVFTLGHLLPRSGVEDGNGNWVFPDGEGPSNSVGDGFEKDESPGPDSEEVVQPTPTNGSGSQSSPGASSSSSTPMAKLRVRRSTFVPGWAVPPRVLLVDDDAVSRRLSSKFLQVFGCAIDVAVDGVGAVNKMNLEKYDLVLMDIVMPKLDGVSATSLIRQFDHMTPIISMTSNSKPSEIMTYYSSGMNDILPKPFTKEGLLDMLEKHLMHLKVIQQMSRVPRSVGVPPLSDGSFNEALAVGAAALSSSSSSANESLSAIPNPDPNLPTDLGIFEDDGRINPLAGMGLSDERYAAILRDLVAGESFAGIGVPEGFSLGMMGVSMNGMGMSAEDGVNVGGEKRGLEDEGELREVKRGRFEVLE